MTCGNCGNVSNTGYGLCEACMKTLASLGDGRDLGMSNSGLAQAQQDRANPALKSAEWNSCCAQARQDMGVM